MLRVVVVLAVSLLSVAGVPAMPSGREATTIDDRIDALAMLTDEGDAPLDGDDEVGLFFGKKKKKCKKAYNKCNADCHSAVAKRCSASVYPRPTDQYRCKQSFGKNGMKSCWVYGLGYERVGPCSRC